nr:hypothetical protein Iba_chr15aCG11290 [Ipomoea batatas]
MAASKVMALTWAVVERFGMLDEHNKTMDMKWFAGYHDSHNYSLDHRVWNLGMITRVGQAAFSGLMAAAAICDLVEGSRTEPRTEREVSNDLARASGAVRTSAECLMGDRDPKPGGLKVAVAVASCGSALGSPEVALVVADLC